MVAWGKAVLQGIVGGGQAGTPLGLHCTNSGEPSRDLCVYASTDCPPLPSVAPGTFRVTDRQPRGFEVT